MDDDDDDDGGGDNGVRITTNVSSVTQHTIYLSRTGLHVSAIYG
jgi:hypothetical protein